MFPKKMAKGLQSILHLIINIGMGGLGEGGKDQYTLIVSARRMMLKHPKSFVQDCRPFEMTRKFE